MTDLTPAEKIKAAIARLEALRGNARPGLWTSTDDDWWWLEGVNHRVVYGQRGAEVAFTHDGDADLIVILHATIDAQLTILRSAFGDAIGSHDEPGAFENATLLAEAILEGGTE